MTFNESEPSPHPYPYPYPYPHPHPYPHSPSPPPLAFHSNDSIDSFYRSCQASDASESECLPRQHQHVHSADDARIKSKWKSLLHSGYPRKSPWNPDATALGNGLCSYCGKNFSLRRTISRNLFRCLCGTLILLGLIMLLSALTALVFTNGVDRIIRVWGKPGHIGEGLSSWPTDFSRDINPIPCHSHNDYWRTVPLYSAINAGCIGVEADIWLFHEELYVGHTTASLTRNRTLNSLYINPILQILSHQNPTTPFHPGADASLNGVFDANPSQTLILLIDFKTAGEALWPHLLSALQPLRERNFLTHLNGTRIVYGPVTVIGTGNTPFHLVASVDSNPHLDVFFDAPLDELSDNDNGENAGSETDQGVVKRGSAPPSGKAVSQKRKADSSQGSSSINAESYNSTNSYYASVSFEKVFGHLPGNRFSDSQMATLRRQIQDAHTKGLKARYWDLPFWPISLRNHVWDVLVQEGVDLLNVDDLKGATQQDWTPVKRWWEMGNGGII